VTSNIDISAHDRGVTACARLHLADLRRLSIPDASLEAVLIPEERARVARFRRAEDRRRYLIGRGLVRGQLGQTLGVAPNEVQLRFGDQGKPFVSGGPSFNLSHSGDFVLVGITEHGRFGLDIEQHSTRPDIAALMRRCFSDWEIERVSKLDAAECRNAFFRIWARKEALLKALGGGLSIELKSVSIDHAPMTENALRDLTLPDEDVHEWTVLPLEVGTRAAAAVAWDRARFEFEITQVCDADLENVIRALAT
jgi:4'-phosphopantetheinyl transferase